jgi:pimeloyl-ACP methyl ester carboxylesterase
MTSGESVEDRRRHGLDPLLPGGRAVLVALPDVVLAVETVGDGVPVLLLHGFPHTRAIWQEMTPVLVDAGLQVVAPDLRGLGDSGQTGSGYDADSLASDLFGVLDSLGLHGAHVVGFDLGAAAAFAMATTWSLTIMEAVVGGLAGAEALLASGAPWWFGFHRAADGLAEQVLVGHEERYVKHFLAIGSSTGVPENLVAHLVERYRRPGALRSAFEHYRAMPVNASRAVAWSAEGRLEMPVLVLGGSTVGDLPGRQLAPYADHLQTRVLPGSGHIVPVDAGLVAAQILIQFVREAQQRCTDGPASGSEGQTARVR